MQISKNLSRNRNTGHLQKNIIANTDAHSHMYFSDGKPYFSPRMLNETENLKEPFCLSQNVFGFEQGMKTHFIIQVDTQYRKITYLNETKNNFIEFLVFLLQKFRTIK